MADVRQIDFRKELSEAQYKAVIYTDGPELVIAGAGSGKTRVLTYKIAYLLNNGMKANRIVALTFTNKAAKEMKERIAMLTSKEAAADLVMGTFHSVFARILRFEIAKSVEVRNTLPYTSKFVIYDKDDSQKVIKEIVEQMHLDPKSYEPSLISMKISTAKNRMITPDGYGNSTLHAEDIEHKRDQVSAIYKNYNLALRKYNAMDFDDLLLNTYLMFKEHENIRLKYATKAIQYCPVDEYQDTNHLQKTILVQLTKENKKICAVGDDAQSIYAFRGAVIENILHYGDDFPGAVTFKLEENYRSTKVVVNAANSLIKQNSRQIPKNLFTNNMMGDKIPCCHASTDKYEAIYVAQTIKRMVLEEGCSYDDFAILYRSNELSRIYEERLIYEQIPRKVYAATSFYQRKEIKDLMAYFRVVINPTDEVALRRILNYPTRGIGNNTMKKIINTAVLNGTSLWDVISRPYQISLVAPKKTMRNILDFTKKINEWQKLLSEDAYTFACKVAKESGIVQLLTGSGKKEDEERYNNVQELLSGIRSFVDEHMNDPEPGIFIEDYVREISLLTDADGKDNNKNIPHVKLMTVHSSKGLEFPYVFVVGLNEGIFPSSRMMSERDLEEERRVFYVAITRAKKKFFLTSARNRYRFGRSEEYEQSRFVHNIDRQYLEDF